MRLISTVLLCLLIVGGTWIYLGIDNSFKREAAEKLYDKAAGKTTVSIERTFECYGNADFNEAAIQVKFAGEDVFVDESNVLSPSTPIEFELKDVEVLENTITVSANATSPDSFGDSVPPLRAMVVKVMHDRRLVAEQMFHIDSNAFSVGGDVNFTVPELNKKQGHAH